MVEGNEDSAVVLTVIESGLIHTVTEIKAKLSGTYGKICQKDFLQPNSTCTLLQREKNEQKRRCFVKYMLYTGKRVEMM